MAEDRGHPDWQQRAAETSQQLLSQTISVNASQTHTSIAFYVGGSRGVGVRVSNVTGGRILLKTRFNGDILGGQVTDDFHAVVRAGDEYHDMIPVIAPYVYFTAQEMAAVNSQFDIQLYTSMSLGRPYTEQEDAIMLIEEDFRNVPAATVEYVNAMHVRPGPAHVELFSYATNWSLAIVAVDSAGTERYVVIVDDTIGPYIGPIYLPSLPLRARFNNADAAAARFRALLWSNPGHH